jgi:hypothetical protein
LKQILLETSAISQRDKATGNLYWGRNVGTKGHEWAQDWAEAYFKKHNLQNIHRKTFDLAPQWAATSFEIQFAAGGKTYNLTSARPAEDSHLRAGGLDLDVAWVGTGSAADFAGRDVKGKAVLIQDIPTPGVLRHSIVLEGAIRRAFDNGAAAVGMMYGISDNFALWELPTGRPSRICRRLRRRQGHSRFDRPGPARDREAAARCPRSSGPEDRHRDRYAAGHDRRGSDRHRASRRIFSTARSITAPGSP